MKSAARRSAKPTPTGGQVRAARLEQARAVGRIAYRLVIGCEIEGFLECDGRTRLRWRKYRGGPLAIDLYEAANRRPAASDWSEMVVRYDGRVVLRVQWNSAGGFKVLCLDQGRDWFSGPDVQRQRRRARA